MSTTRLLLIRHAEVESRYQKVFGGSIDMEISPRGHEQAWALADYLQRKQIDAIYASPMKRVQQTLAPLLKNNTKVTQPVILPDLREVDFGDWTGHGWEAVHRQFGVNAWEWLDKLERGTVPNGENSDVFRARVEPCLRDILLRHLGQTVAIFCHGGVIRMILSILLELPLPKMGMFDIEYASVSKVVLHAHKTEIELLNFVPWHDPGQ